jgi:hypothetical protein
MKTVSLFVSVCFGATLVGMGTFVTSVNAQSPAACTGEEYRQLDFWLGSWDLSWTPSGEGDTGKGTNDITLILDDCVVQESFKGAGFIGHSVSLYHAPPKKWRQTWVDNSGGYFALVGGPDDEGFRLDLTRISDKAPYMRMIWRNIEKESMDWHWQRSPDEGKTWADSWVIHYVRRSR